MSGAKDFARVYTTFESMVKKGKTSLRGRLGGNFTWPNSYCEYKRYYIIRDCLSIEING